MKLLSILVLSVCLPAATVEVRQTGPAVSFAYIRGYSSSCKWNLYEGTSATGTPHADVSASVDTDRADTIYDDFGTRIMRLGHDYGDNFLKVNTQYTLATDASDTGCTGTSSVTFRTYFQPAPVIQRSFIPKWDASTYTKTKQPSYDWTISGRRKQYVTDPGGVPFELFDQAAGSGSWGTYYPYSSTGAYVYAPSGWTTPANAIAGNTSTYTAVTSTSAAVLYPVQAKNTWYTVGADLTIENMGLETFGNASSATTADRQFDLCFSFTTVAGTCAGTAFTITLPQGGSVVAVPSTPTWTDAPVSQFNAFPNDFPKPGWEGWGSLTIRRDQFPISATASAVSGVVTASSGYFPYTVVGNYLLINGQYKAVASQQSDTQVTLTDGSFSASSGTVVSLPFGIIAKRKTSTGTANIGFKFVFAGSDGNYAFGGNVSCHPLSTTYGSIKGRWCVGMRQGGPGGAFTFVADDPAVLNSSNAGAVWPATYLAAYPSATGITDVRDRPNDFYPDPGLDGYGYDTVDPNVIYGVERCDNGASKCVFKFTIHTIAPQYAALAGRIDGVFSSWETTSSAGGVVITNVTPPSLGLDLASQIAGNAQWGWTHQGIYANYPSFASATFSGFSGSKAFFSVWHGQDNAPAIFAVVEMQTGRVIRVFSTHDQGEVGGIPIRYGSIHSAAGVTQLPNSLLISSQFPSRGNNVGSGTLMGPPLALKIIGVQRNGAMSANTSLSTGVSMDGSYPFASSYDVAGAYDNTCANCADVPAWIMTHWTGTDEFVTMDVDSQICSERWGASTSSDAGVTYGGTCSWNDSYWKTPYDLRVGDRFSGYSSTAPSWVCAQGTVGDCEVFMVVKILNAGGNGTPTKIVAHRNDAWDYSCVSRVAGQKPDCVDSPTQLQWPNGWQGRMVAGRAGTAGNVPSLILFDSTGCPANQTITCGTYQYGEEPARTGYGHSALGLGTEANRYIQIGVFAFRNATFEQLTGLDSTKGPLVTNAPLNFAGQQWDNINGYEAHDQGSAPLHEQAWSMNFNAFNGGDGGPHALGNGRNITPVSGCTNVYKLNTMNSGYYKISPLLGWAGHNMLEDISGPSVDICAAHDYSFVYVQRSSDSIGITSGANGITPAAGDVFIKVPALNRSSDTSGCVMGFNRFLNDPCVLFLKGSGQGAMRRGYYGVDDNQGKFSQLIGYGAGLPGMNLVFSQIHPTTSGASAVAHTGFDVDGVRNAALLFHLPPFRITHHLVNTMFNSSVSVPAFAGATHARIRFGFDPGTFYCSGRAEACVTDSVMNTDTNPYAYIGETLNPHSCSSGCTIPLPVDLGRAFFYQIEWMKSGTVVKTSSVGPLVAN